MNDIVKKINKPTEICTQVRSGEEGDKATFVDKTSTDLYYKKDRLSIKGLVYGVLMPLSTIFQLYRGGFNQRVNRLDHIFSLG
jgi:hypothetical protein